MSVTQTEIKVKGKYQIVYYWHVLFIIDTSRTTKIVNLNSMRLNQKQTTSENTLIFDLQILFGILI